MVLTSEVRCPGCNAEYEVAFDDPDIILEPWPHIECEDCGTWVPVF